MNFGTLVEMQRAGALNVDKERCNKEQVCIANIPMTYAQSEMFARNLGWTGRKCLEPYLLVEKTDMYVRNLAKYIEDDEFYELADLTFENMRLSDSVKTFDRIVIKMEENMLTIIHGMPGLGGAYAVFNPFTSKTQPIFTSRTIKGVGEFINDMT